MKGYWIAKYKKAEDAKKLGNYAEKALKLLLILEVSLW